MSGALARWRAARPDAGEPIRVVWVDEVDYRRPAASPSSPPQPGEDQAVELAARALAAARLGDAAAAGRVVDRMLADPWWSDVVEAAVYRALGRGAG